MKRSRKSLLGEFVLWALVSLATAFILIQLSETLLPANF